ncbi:MAG: tetratricopeptide repeat protein [Nostoc sp. DedQUE05]|uniref:tetratricopeptide repeat protein n=1 Tax=Nostoc sp. DedQUE05 TaxID=3075391 RepID=UPI002AD26229|nr:tetratricopeptide repeat protein [Nostoc sp. DedQUE05]MDZ8091586.1 tetratricopeptide repeat protein [Nostoc sp. DedQUE05]
MKNTILLISSLLLLPFPVVALKIPPSSFSQAGMGNSNCDIKPENGESGEFSEKQLQIIAKRITVRVIGDNNGGSGTLLAKKGNTYLVITNFHVVRGVNNINLQTSDGKTYPAQILLNTNFDKFDLALLQFQTEQNYCLPKEIAASVPNPETPVMAAGYSSEKGEIVFRTGTIQQIASRPLKEGYQIGYSSDIEQGMSGGAILNSRGELIGINGRSPYPISNTGYVYPDGFRPSEEEIKQMRKFSWGIPISTVLAQVNSEILTAYSLPTPKTFDGIPQTTLTGWLGELEQKAKKITVRIDSSSGANGSGVIIAKDGDTYTVLTASHVVCERKEAKQSCGDHKYQILAPLALDGKQYQYPVDKSTIKKEEGVDLAIVKFSSKENYEIATLANYNPNNFNYIFTAGYPKLGNNSPWRFTAGQIFDKERGLLQTQQSDFQSNSSGKLQSASSLTGGYELVYSSITYSGMSGGPVLDSQGRVIGIHGRAEGEEAKDEKTGDSGISGGKAQIGYSLGVPVSTFLGFATRFGVKLQNVEKNTSALQLNSQQIKSIQEAVLSADVSKGNATASQWLERGNQMWRLNRYEEAVNAFDEAIKLKPSFAYLAYYGKSLALAWQEKYQQAVKALEEAVKLKDNFVAPWQLQSFVYRQLKQPDKALVAIEKAIQNQPKNPNLYNEKREVLSRLKRYAEAEAAITKAISLSPRAVFYDNRGVLYYEQKKWDLAAADFNKAIDINPQFTQAYSNRGGLYYELKKWELAVADFNKAIAINPQYAQTYYNRGYFYYKLEKWNLAVADYNKAIDINPQYAQAYYNRGVLYQDQKKWDLAIADYNKAININSQYADAYINRGLLYYEHKKLELALADYNKAIAINPQYAQAYSNRGAIYYEQKKLELALADYNKAIDISPHFAETYYNRGTLYKEQKKWDLALNDFNKAITINPQDAKAHYNRGNFYKEQKKWNLAVADYNKAIEVNPHFFEAYYNRGLLYQEQKKWDLAVADYNKAININSQFANTYYLRGLLYQEQKKWDLVIADYNKAIEINPQFANAYAGRGIVHTIMGDKQKAIQDLQKAAQLFKAQNNTVAYEEMINILKQLQK